MVCNQAMAELLVVAGVGGVGLDASVLGRVDGQGSRGLSDPHILGKLRGHDWPPASRARTTLTIGVPMLPSPPVERTSLGLARARPGV